MGKLRPVRGIKENEYGEWIVRFTYNNHRYPTVNYTKKYQCKTREDTENKVREFKKAFEMGEDPFDKKKFGEYMEDYFAELEKKGTKTSYIYQTIYNKYAKSELHHLEPSNIQKAHIADVYENMVDKKDDKGNYCVNSNDYLEKMRRILSPTFKYLKKDEKISKNILELVKVPILKRHIALPALSIRLKDQQYIDVARKLYRGIQKIEKDDVKFYLLFTLMTMRRRSETFSITPHHITGQVIDATINMTKTNIDERYPIPDELMEYLEGNKKAYPLKCDIHDFGTAWKQVLKDEDIDYVQEFRVRDTRNIFMSLMRKKYNRELVGACISHFQGDVNEIYSSYEFEDRKEIFEKYWEILRSPIEESTT